jgi:hypothetical protein
VGDRGGGDRVVEEADAVHLASALVDRGAVEQQGQQPVCRQELDEVDDQAPPELVRRPLAFADPADSSEAGRSVV